MDAHHPTASIFCHSNRHEAAIRPLLIDVSASMVHYAFPFCFLIDVDAP